MSEGGGAIPLAPPQAQKCNFGDLHEMSVALMEVMEGEEIGEATAAVGLTLGRLFGRAIMDTEAEMVFLHELFEWMQMYFVEGRAQ